MKCYILTKDHEIIEEPNVAYFGRWFEDLKNRKVKQAEVGPYFVSTIFLGIDHNWSKQGPPRLFETMVFPGKSSRDLYCERYTTWDEAVKGHDRIATPEFLAANIKTEN